MDSPPPVRHSEHAPDNFPRRDLVDGELARSSAARTQIGDADGHAFYGVVDEDAEGLLWSATAGSTTWGSTCTAHMT